VVDIVGGVPAVATEVLWLPVTSGRNLMAEFCARADLYCTSDHLDMTIDTDREGGQVVTLATAAALGRELWADVAELER
jgi:hypothetical protein